MKRLTACMPLLFFTLTACAAEDNSRPNIIYILADDLGIGDVAAYNAESRIATPNLDELASDGLRFSDAHTSSAVCTPTRYGILTGRYAWRTHLKNGVLNGHSDHLIDTGRETVASLLKRQGYATAVVGKWHLGMDWQTEDGVSLKANGIGAIPDAPVKNGPNAVGFDYYFGISASLNMSPHAYIENDRMLGELVLLETDDEVKEAGLVHAKVGWFDKAFRQDQVMTTFVDKSIDWIRGQNAKDATKPFFLYLPLNAPHGPIVPREDFVGRSELSPHGDFVEEVDYHVGRIMAALAELGISDDTLVIFTADNGVSPGAKLETMQEQGHYSSGIYRGLKGSLYEGGHREPFIVRWPKHVTAGGTSDYHLSTTDLIATVADIIDEPLAPDAGEDSVSFLHVLNGAQLGDKARGGLVYHSDAGYYSIREDRWKLILHEEGGTRRKNPKDAESPVKNASYLQLFDIVEDPTERVSVAAEYPEIVKRLGQLLQEYIDNGRSTPGPAQQNEAPVNKKPWRGIDRLQNLSTELARPNVILLMADDLGYGDTGFNGNTIIKTPSLDQMAADGALMTNFHAGAPVCSPTRGTALTGRHAFRYGIYSANKGFLRPEEVTISELLLEQGYATGHFGKWHLGTLSKTSSSKGEKRDPEKNYSPPAWHGYERSFVTESAVATWNPTQGGRAKDNPFWGDGVALDPEDPSLAGGAGRIVMDRAIPFIRQAVADGKPFFAVIWFHAPHEPIVAGPDYLAMYEGHGEAAHYYGAITEMDEQIGRLRAELEELGVAGNTFVTFTSDNGPEGKEAKGMKAGTTGGLRGRKRSLYEGGVRVPTVTVWPGNVAPGTVIEAPASTLDYLPTVLDMLDVSMPDERPLDGESMLPLLTRLVNVRQTSIPFWHKGKMALIEGKLKLVITPDKPQSDELYELSIDPSESSNIIADNVDIAARMRRRIEAFAESAEASDNGADY